MIFKNKKFKTAMAALAILTIFGGTVNSSYAAELTNSQGIALASAQRVELKTSLRHETEDKESSAQKNLEGSYLKIENGKRYMVLVFNSGSMLESIVPSINGEEVKDYTSVLEGDTKTVTFEIGSLNDDIRLSFVINTGFFKLNVGCIVKSQISTGTEEDDKDDTVTSPTQKPENPETPDEDDKDEDNRDEDKDQDDKEDSDDTVTGPTQKPENPDDNNTEDNNNNGSNIDKDEEASNTTYKNGYYQVKNIVVSDSETGYAMVRGIVNETSNLEIRDGKYYLTFEMGQSSLMKNIVIKANSKTLDYTQKNVGNDTIRITVEIPSLSSTLNISTYISAMGRSVDFGLKLNKSTLTFISSNEEAELPENNNNNSNNGNVNGGNTGSEDFNTGNNGNDRVENETVKGKLYTIKNKVVHENETGRQMARKYLNETSKIEEIDGQLYLTLTFTGVDLMNNHKFYVNGKLVSYQVTSSSSTSKSYRFKINSLSDDIKVSAFIVPMNRNVEFGVELLEDTYTFVKDFEVSGDGNVTDTETDIEKLPQTGSVINAESMLMGGSLITALGAFIGRRKRK